MSSKSLSETDGGGGLSFSEGSGSDSCYYNVFTVPVCEGGCQFHALRGRKVEQALLAVLEGVEDLELYFRLVFTVHLQVVDWNSDFGGEDIDRLGSLRFGDFDVAAQEQSPHQYEANK